MTKIKIVSDSFNNFSSAWWHDFFSRWFEFESYQSDKSYPRNTLFWMDYFSVRLDTHLPSEFFSQSLEQGRKVVYDNLSESLRSDIDSRAYILHNYKWFWYNESCWYRCLGYDKYRPNKTYSRLALMPMRRPRKHRDDLLIKMSPWLHQCYWSYLDHGRPLPGDRDYQHHDVQRDFLPQWYDDTHFSIVAETMIFPQFQRHPFITEKTMKPLAFYHPFLLWSQVKSLSLLKWMGFETFENIFDESYDQELTDVDRLEKIIDNVRSFVPGVYDSLTQEKLEHNHNHFFNRALVEQRVQEEIVNPLIEYAES